MPLFCFLFFFILTDTADEGPGFLFSGRRTRRPGGWASATPLYPPGQGFVRRGRQQHVLHRYSMRGFTLGRPVKVCVCSSEGAGTGSRMTPAFAPPDVTAQLGRLMTEGAGHARTCPSRESVVEERMGDLSGRSIGKASDRCRLVLYVGEKEPTELQQPPHGYQPLAF